MGISPDLKPPYSYVVNASFAREIPGKMTVEIGYTGRLAHRLLMEGDVYTPLEYFKDPKSGVTWEQNNAKVRALSDAGLTPAAVQTNPNLVPTLPFVENMFPALKNVDFPGSASANYFNCVYGDYNGSYLDCLHALDRNVTSSYIPGQCLSVTGCYTFFPTQGSSMPTWMNAGFAQFHGLTLALRRSFRDGFAFDFNSQNICAAIEATKLVSNNPDVSLLNRNMRESAARFASPTHFFDNSRDEFGDLIPTVH